MKLPIIRISVHLYHYSQQIIKESYQNIKIRVCIEIINVSKDKLETFLPAFIKTVLCKNNQRVHAGF